jgi:hypothetical protein
MGTGTETWLLSLQRYSPPLSLSAVRASIPAWWHNGLSVSRPRRGGPSGPWHGDATGGPAQQVEHKWLPNESGSLSQSCGRCLLAVSHSRYHRPAAYGELHTRRRALLSPKQQGDVLCIKHMLQAYVWSVLDVLEVCCKCFIWILQK